jgi:Sulfotransferase family
MAAPPIFIVGSPRSGTGLMRQILDRHPSLAVCRETQFYRLVYLRRRAFGDLGDIANRRRLIGEYLTSRHIKRAGLDTAEFSERLLREATSYQAMFTAILNYYAETQGKQRYGEKTPQHALFLETLCEWFPGAVILHMVRDPRASVASMQHMPWRGSVVANARIWLKLNEAARRFQERPGYLEVRYEALVTDSARELSKICSFLGEEYSPSMLLPEESAGGSSRLRWRTAITSERLDVWRNELTAAEVAQIEWVLGPQLESFGYVREAAPASAVTVLRGVSYAAFDLARFVAARLPAVWYRFGAQTNIAKFEYWSGPKAWRKRAGGR